MKCFACALENETLNEKGKIRSFKKLNSMRHLTFFSKWMSTISDVPSMLCRIVHPTWTGTLFSMHHCYSFRKLMVNHTTHPVAINITSYNFLLFHIISITNSLRHLLTSPIQWPPLQPRHRTWALSAYHIKISSSRVIHIEDFLENTNALH